MLPPPQSPKTVTLNEKSHLSPIEAIEQKEIGGLKEENAEEAHPDLNDPIKQFALVCGHAAESSIMPKEVENAWSTPGHILSLLEEQSRASGASQCPDSLKHSSPNANQQSS